MFIRFRVFLPSATYILMSLYGSILVSMVNIMDKLPGSFYQSTEEAFVGKILQIFVSSLGYRSAVAILPVVDAP